jgi:GNAT superfamily N-acetyltransferase
MSGAGGSARGLTVRDATVADLRYIVSLAKREYEAIGFIPSSRYEGTVTRCGEHARPGAWLWIAEAEGEPIGFALGSNGVPGGSVKVLQLCVQEDARRLDFGTAIVTEAEAVAGAIQRPGVSLAVAADLEASRFWEANGYGLLRLEEGGRKRKRVLERRYKRLACGLFLEAV